MKVEKQCDFSWPNLKGTFLINEFIQKAFSNFLKVSEKYLVKGGHACFRNVICQRYFFT